MLSETNLSGIDLKETILAEGLKKEDLIRVRLRKTILIGRLEK